MGAPIGRVIKTFRRTSKAQKIQKLRQAVDQAQEIATARKTEAVAKLAESKELAKVAEAAEIKKAEALTKIREAKDVLSKAEGDYVYADQRLFHAQRGELQIDLQEAERAVEQAHIARETARETVRLAEAEVATTTEQARVAKRAADAASADAIYADQLAVAADQQVLEAKGALTRAGGSAAAMVAIPGEVNASHTSSHLTSEKDFSITGKVLDVTSEVLDVPTELAADAADVVFSPITSKAGHKVLGLAEDAVAAVVTSEVAAPVVNPLFKGAEITGEGIDQSLEAAGNAIWLGIKPAANLVGFDKLPPTTSSLSTAETSHRELKFVSYSYIPDNPTPPANAKAAIWKAAEQGNQISSASTGIQP